MLEMVKFICWLLIQQHIDKVPCRLIHSDEQDTKTSDNNSLTLIYFLYRTEDLPVSPPSCHQVPPCAPVTKHTSFLTMMNTFQATKVKEG